MPSACSRPLLLAGGVSDQVGRRPVLLVALAGLVGQGLLYLFADSAAWLFAARGLQGLATGAAQQARRREYSTCIPAVTRPASPWRARPRRPGGLGLGMLSSPCIAYQIGWHPRLLPTSALLSADHGRLRGGACLMPEPVRTRGRFRLTVQTATRARCRRRPFCMPWPRSLPGRSARSFSPLAPALAAHLFHEQRNRRRERRRRPHRIRPRLPTLTGRSAPWLAASAGSIALAAGPP